MNASRPRSSEFGSEIRQAFSRGVKRRRGAALVDSRPEGLYGFLLAFWNVIEAEDLVPGRHLREVCAHLEAVSRGEIPTLVVNIPPGHTKSALVNVFWPAWEWAEVDSSLRYLCSSHREDLSIRDSVKMRRLIESPAYRGLYGHRFELTGDQNAKTRYENTAKGYRLVVPMSRATGERVDRVLLDDPNSLDSVYSAAERQHVITAYSDGLILRKGDKKRFAVVIVMQRLHEDDLSGHVLGSDPNVVHVCLPEKFDPAHPRPYKTRWGEEWRTEPGALLWPERNGLEDVTLENAKMSSFAVAGQKQQNPAPTEGGVFNRADLRYWVPRDRPDLARKPVRLADGTEVTPEVVPFTLEDIRRGLGFEAQVQSWDMAEKDKLTSAFTVGQVWGAVGANRYLLHQTRGRWAYSVILEEIASTTALHPNAIGKYVEEKALGVVAVQQLRDHLTGIVGLEPDGGKIARAYAVEPVFKAKQVFIPHPDLFPWVGDWVLEVTTFPASSYADQVDTTTQALKVLMHHSGSDDDSDRIIGNRRRR
jgi:predicted phage terminase large subunit-like protein